MADVNTGCKHFWREDQEELNCFYCGMMLYRNREETGPHWIPPKPGDKPPWEKGDRGGWRGRQKK